MACVAAALACGPPGGAVTVATPEHLLLISVDTLRGDHLGAYGYGEPTSPQIDAFAAESVVFESAQSTSSWTLPALASIMTSLPTSSHGCWSGVSSLGAAFQTLAETLHAAGFRTGAVANHVFLGRPYGLDQGFESYDDELVLPPGTVRADLTVTSEAVTRKGLAWLRERAGAGDAARSFLWVHYFDPHMFYQWHPGVSERFGTTTPWGVSYTLHDRYEGEIAFTDAAIGALLRGLDELGLRDSTAVILVADHGEEFGEHGDYAHRRTLHRESLQVPLIVRAPGIAARRVGTQVSVVDLFPTVLELFGLETAAPLLGSSLVPLLRGQTEPPHPALAELQLGAGRHHSSYSDGRFKLIARTSGGHPLPHLLYDLSRDAAEQNDISAESPEQVTRLWTALQSELQRARQLGDRFEKGPRIELSPEDRERLRALGYAAH